MHIPGLASGLSVWVLAMSAVVSIGVPASADHSGRTCATSVRRHSACVEVFSSSVAGELRNDGGEKSCGEFLLNLTTYERNGHRFEHAGDERMSGCLPPGGWRVSFRYVDPSLSVTPNYDGARKYKYSMMCVKGYRIEGGRKDLVTGSACHTFPSDYDH